ncbi:MAG: YitT family protein [Granulosicoccus sp.]
MSSDLDYTQPIELSVSNIAPPTLGRQVPVSEWQCFLAAIEGVYCFKASRRRMFAGFIGPLLLGIGSGVSVSAGFGSLGFAVLLDGLNSSVGVPLWFSQVLVTLLFYFIAWFWAKIPLGMGTLPTVLLIGPLISLGATLTPEALPFAGHVVAFVIGLFLFSFGISLSAAAALGPDGVTALSLAAEKRHRVPVPRATFVWNATAIVLGITLGGSYGVATFVGLVLVPVFIQLMLPWLREKVGSVQPT